MRLFSVATPLIVLLLLSCGGESPPDDQSQEAPASTEAESVSGMTEQENPDTNAVSETLPEETPAVTAGGPEGTWDTTMGELVLTVDDSGMVTGEYPLGTIEGNLEGAILDFSYDEGSLSGSGTFEFSDDFRSFTGTQDISGTELVWEGSRI